MPATIDIYRWYNDHVTNMQMTQAITSVLASFYTSNDPVAQQYPVAIDRTLTGGGTRYSYCMPTRLHATTSPAGVINNLKWYSSSYPSDWTPGCTANVADVGASYTTPTGTLYVTGSTIFTVTGFVSHDVSTYPSGSPLAVTGSVTHPVTGNFGDFVYLQALVQPKWLNSTTQSGVTPGTRSPLTITWQYDET